MFYLCLAVTVAWLVYFAYLFILDRQVRDLRKRLDARTTNSQEC
ncbi:MAG: CcmD family protein [Planctomycetota bacterium]|jgi:CcmD family protein